MNNLFVHEQAICARCSAEFTKTHIRQKYCGCKPTKLQTTLEQSLVVQRFRNICNKYNLHFYATFQTVTGSVGNNFYYLTDPKLHDHMSKTRIKLWCKLLDRFNKQFEQGYYKLIPGKNRYFACKLAQPTPKECPKKLSHCPGAVIIGSCPRQWRECPLAEVHVGLRRA